MKTKLLTLAMSFIALSSFAQRPHFRFLKPDQNKLHSAIPPIQTQLRIEGAKVQLDSLVIAGQEKETYTYTANGYIGISYSWDSTGKYWVHSSKFENDYDTNGNNTLYVGYTWVDSVSQWVGSYKSEYTYNSNGKQTSAIDYEWADSANQWIGMYKEEMSYNVKGNQTEDAFYIWNKISSKFTGSSQTMYAYDAYGNKISSDVFYWDTTSNQWSTNSSITYSYKNTLDNMNRATVSISFSSFGDSTKNEYAYDSYGNLILSASYYWNGSAWVGSSKTEYTYNANGKQTMYASYNWNSTANQWVGSTRNEYTFDVNGNEITAIEYRWDSNMSQWVEGYKDEYTFDTSILSSSLTVPYTSADGFVDKVISISEYSWVNGAWSTPASGVLYYSNVPTGITPDAIFGNTISLYPNPAKEKLELEGASFGNYQIQDLTGKTLQSAYTQENSINVDQLRQGVYILRLQQGKNAQVLKFVKE